MNRPPSARGARNMNTVNNNNNNNMAALRTNTRPGSSFKRVPTAIGASVNNTAARPLDIAPRPTTAQGLPIASVQTLKPGQTLGPGRQIADHSYYLISVKNHISDITKEIERLNDEINQTANDETVFGKLERKYENVVKEVREYEGQLADFNLALDKLRTNTDVNEIIDIYQSIKPRNEELKRTIDEIFMKRTTGEKYTEQLMNEYDDTLRKVANELSNTDENLNYEFNELINESKQLKETISNSEEILSNLNDRIEATNEALDSPMYHAQQNANTLKERIMQLHRKREELLEETNQSLSPEELKEQLLKRVKDYSQDIKDMEEELVNEDNLIEDIHEKIQKQQDDLQEAKKHSQKAKKYDALYERDQKMQEFIDKFQENKKTEDANLKKLQNTIVALAEHISTNLGRGKNLPDEGRLKTIREELSVKEKTTKHSQETLEHLKQERAKRRLELEKIDNLDEKITKEIDVFKQKMQRIDEQINNFYDPEQQKVNTAKETDIIRNEMKLVKRQRDEMKQKVLQISQEYEKLKREFSSKKSAFALEEVENKLSSYAQSTFELREFVESHKRESDYMQTAKKCESLVNDLNNLCISYVNIQ